jgi:hypothetical protein
MRIACPGPGNTERRKNPPRIVQGVRRNLAATGHIRASEETHHNTRI